MELPFRPTTVTVMFEPILKVSPTRRERMSIDSLLEAFQV
jgi:hypothetical protein